jgi:hypothetical protein
MVNTILLQLTTLGLYTLFMGFCFCDGFKLHILRKLLWFIVFTTISIYVFEARGEYDLALILPFPTILAMALGFFQQHSLKK